MTSGDRWQTGFPSHISRIGTLMLKPGSATPEVVLRIPCWVFWDWEKTRSDTVVLCPVYSRQCSFTFFMDQNNMPTHRGWLQLLSITHPGSSTLFCENSRCNSAALSTVSSLEGWQLCVRSNPALTHFEHRAGKLELSPGIKCLCKYTYWWNRLC